MAEEREVIADEYESKGDHRFARQAARHAGGFYEQAGYKGEGVSFECALKYHELALRCYKRGKSHVYAERAQWEIDRLRKDIVKRDAYNARWLASTRRTVELFAEAQARHNEVDPPEEETTP